MKEDIISSPLGELRSGAGPSGHQRGISEASVIDRGRPMRRGDISLERILSRSMKRFRSADGTMHGFLVGVKPPYISSKLSLGGIGRLKKQIEEQVARFKVLHEINTSIFVKLFIIIHCTPFSVNNHRSYVSWTNVASI